MAVEKTLDSLQMADIANRLEESQPSIVVEIEEPESVSIETEDGGVIIEFDPRSEDEDADGQAHNANLGVYGRRRPSELGNGPCGFVRV